MKNYLGTFRGTSREDTETDNPDFRSSFVREVSVEQDSGGYVTVTMQLGQAPRSAETPHWREQTYRVREGYWEEIFNEYFGCFQDPSTSVGAAWNDLFTRITQHEEVPQAYQNEDEERPEWGFVRDEENGELGLDTESENPLVVER